MSLFLERFVNGLADGSIYALLALALVVVFRSTGQLNFAQGEIGTMGAFFVSTLTLSGLPVWLSIGCAMVLGFLVSAGVERIVVRPIEHRNPGAVIVALIGVFLAVNQIVAMIWGVDARSLPSVFPDDADDFVTIGGAPIRIARLGIIGVLIVVLFLLWLMFNKTKVGLAMRAVANNQESSNLVGIRVGSILVVGWGWQERSACLPPRCSHHLRGSPARSCWVRSCWPPSRRCSAGWIRRSVRWSVA
jgi:branched-chain amino acid transport system permease protein